MPEETTKAGSKEDRQRQALERWLAARIDGARDLRIGGVLGAGAGFSADTAFVEAQWRQDGTPKSASLVLRRQILGHDLLHQPDLGFQAQVMAQLSGRPGLPVPAVIGIESDASVLGVPFLVMQRLPGRILQQHPNYNLAGWLHDLPATERGAVWANSLRTMAKVHRVDWREGLAFLARGKTPGLAGYIDWVADWLNWAVAGRDYPVGTAAIAWLRDNMPADVPISVVWGDSIPVNTLYSDTGEVTGLIDWELATLGPGEIDLAWWLLFDDLFSLDSHVRRLEGLPSRDEAIAIYQEALGRKVGDVAYYEVLGRLRLAIITMRVVDRQVNLGRYKADNDAWSGSTFTSQIAGGIGFAPIPVTDDFHDFQRKLLAREL